MHGDRHHQVQERRPLLFRRSCQEARLTTGLQEECGVYDHSEARRIEEPARLRSFSSQVCQERREAFGAGPCGRCEGGSGRQCLVQSCAAVEDYFRLHTGELLLFCLQLAEQILH